MCDVAFFKNTSSPALIWVLIQRQSAI